MFLQGGLYLYEAWHTLLAARRHRRQAADRCPCSRPSTAFLFGIVLVIFAYGIAIGFVFTLPEGYGQRLPAWMNVAASVSSRRRSTEVVIVVLIVIFARIVVEAEWQASIGRCWCFPASILFIAAALR